MWGWKLFWNILNISSGSKCALAVLYCTKTAQEQCCIVLSILLKKGVWQQGFLRDQRFRECISLLWGRSQLIFVYIILRIRSICSDFAKKLLNTVSYKLCETVRRSISQHFLFCLFLLLPPCPLIQAAQFMHTGFSKQKVTISFFFFF